MKKSVVILLAATAMLAACNKEQKGKGGLLYTVHKDAGQAKIKEGDIVKIDFIQKNDKDSILDATYDVGFARAFPVGKKQYSGDMNDVLTLFGEGDSVTFKLNIDTMLFYNKEPRPEKLKDQKYLTFTVKFQKVFAKKPNEADTTFQKRANEFFEADYKATVEQNKKNEDSKIKKYIADNGLKVTTTPSGLQYVIKEAGQGPKPMMGDTAMVNYMGQLTNKRISGKLNVFDTNIEKVFRENLDPTAMRPFAPVPMPLAPNIAQGFVEALQLIGKGGKITAIMPSKLAYGEMGSMPVIPPYAPLVFDIEITDIKKGSGQAAPAAPVAPAVTPAGK